MIDICGIIMSHAPVAQRIRASVFGTECRGFESLRVRFLGELAPRAVSCANPDLGGML